MNRFIFILLLLNKVYLQDTDKENDVYILNNDNFDDAINAYRPIFVNFYAPWCQFSQKLKPHFERVAEDFVHQKIAVRLGKVDAVQETELAQRFNIQQFPTLLLFKEDRQIPFNKTHNYMIISNWLIAKTNDLVLRINSRDEYQRILEKYDVILIIAESKLVNDYILAAESVDDIQFVVCESNLFDYLFPNYKDASLIIRRKVDMMEVPFNGINTKENIKRFVMIHGLPSVVTYSVDNGAKIFSNPYKKRLFLLFISGEYYAVKSELENAAVNHNDVRFVIIDVSQNVSDSVVAFFKVDKTKVPFMLLSDTHATKSYIPDFDDIDGTKLSKFIEDVKNGRVEQFLRSQPIPDNWDAEPVKVLVGKNFEEVVYDKRKHVFVEFC